MDLIRRLGRMMRPPPPRALSTARWEDTGGGRCGAGTGAVTAVAEPGEAVVSCRSTGYGPFASPAEIATTVHLPSDRATGLIGFASKTRAIEVAVGDQDVELRARTAEDGWEVLEVGRLDAFSSDVAVRLTVVDGVATATVGSVRLTSEVPTDDAAGHLRLDAVVLGSESAGGGPRFLRPILRLGAGVATDDAQLAAASGTRRIAVPMRSTKLSQ